MTEGVQENSRTLVIFIYLFIFLQNLLTYHHKSIFASHSTNKHQKGDLKDRATDRKTKANGIIFISTQEVKLYFIWICMSV